MLTILFNQYAVAVPRKRGSRELEDSLLAILRREDEELITFVPAFMEIIRRAFNR